MQKQSHTCKNINACEHFVYVNSYKYTRKQSLVLSEFEKRVFPLLEIKMQSVILNYSQYLGVNINTKKINKKIMA